MRQPHAAALTLGPWCTLRPNSTHPRETRVPTQWITAVESVVTLQHHGAKSGYAKILDVQSAKAAKAHIERLRARQAALEESLANLKNQPPKSLLSLTFINELAVASVGPVLKGRARGEPVWDM